MEEIILITPTLKYEKSVMEYRSEFIKNREDLAGGGNLRIHENYQNWLDELTLFKSEKTTPVGRVPSSMFLAVRKKDEYLVGIIDLRHHINHPILKVWGGHIGYSVRKAERNKGYATQMLALVIKEAEKIGLEKILLTCDNENLSSENVILKNHGIFEKEVMIDGEIIKRYWVPTKEKK